MKNFYFVSQSKTYKYERSGSYLWAPYTNKTGGQVPYYDSIAIEGTPKHIHPWKIEEKDLTVSSITYSYKVT